MTALANQGVCIAVGNLEKLGCAIAKLGVIPREKVARIGVSNAIKYTAVNQRTLKARDIGVPNIAAILKYAVGIGATKANPRDEGALPVERRAIRIAAPPVQHVGAVGELEQIGQCVFPRQHVVVHHPNPVVASLVRELHTVRKTTCATGVVRAVNDVPAHSGMLRRQRIHCGLRIVGAGIVHHHDAIQCARLREQRLQAFDQPRTAVIGNNNGTNLHIYSLMFHVKARQGGGLIVNHSISRFSN